ncbi:MAG: hypothetical protein R6X02_27240 [Enhygromyxa sp.]
MPKLEWHGQRVSVGSNLDHEVCASTLQILDSQVEEVEFALGIESSHRISVWLLQPEFVDFYCGSVATACVSDGRMISGPDGLGVSRHELVHAVLWHAMDMPKPLFGEGLAVAVGGPCDYYDGCLEYPDCANAPIDLFLEQRSSAELGVAGYYAGADLVDGMLKQHGPAAVLAFIATIDAAMPPNKVRERYTQTFGRDLDEDFEVYKRGRLDDVSLAQIGCEHLFAPVEEGGVPLRGTSTCDPEPLVSTASVG